jgi:hypothetical protein
MSCFESVEFNDTRSGHGTAAYVPGVQGECRNSPQNFPRLKNNVGAALHMAHTIQLR